MIGFHPDCPAGVSLLADHLDTTLAVGEDLLCVTLAPRADLDEQDPDTAPEALDAFVRRLRQLEASLLLRLLQARRLIGEIGRADASLKAAGALFRAQSDALYELIAASGRSEPGALAAGADGHAFLRSRGLLAPEAGAPSPFERLTVSEAFRVGGVAPLGQLLDVVSAVLDLLDARFGLYAPERAVDEADGGLAEERDSSHPRIADQAAADDDMTRQPVTAEASGPSADDTRLGPVEADTRMATELGGTAVASESEQLTLPLPLADLPASTGSGDQADSSEVDDERLQIEAARSSGQMSLLDRLVEVESPA
ncbi:MAG: hypothetical protein AB7O57_15445 [Hyphomicrobiaceae bacterium]